MTSSSTLAGTFPCVLARMPHKLQYDILEVLDIYHESESKSAPVRHVLLSQTRSLADYARKKKFAQMWKGYVISPGFWCFTVPLGARPLPTLSVYTTICSIILNLVV